MVLQVGCSSSKWKSPYIIKSYFQYPAGRCKLCGYRFVYGRAAGPVTTIKTTVVGRIMIPQRSTGSIPQNLWMLPDMAKGLSRCDWVKHVEMGRLSRLSLRTQHNHKAPHEGWSGGEKEGNVTTEMEKKMWWLKQRSQGQTFDDATLLAWNQR